MNKVEDIMNNYKEKFLVLANALEIENAEQLIHQPNEVIEGVGRCIAKASKIHNYYDVEDLILSVIKDMEKDNE